MFTLLTSEQKKKLVIEYRLRLVIIFLLVLSTISFILIILSIPAYLELQSRYSYLASEEKSLSEYISSKNDKDISKAIDDLNQNLGVASLSTLVPTKIVDDIFLAKSKGIDIQSFDLNKINKEESTMRIRRSSDRKTLTSFVKSLQNNPIMKKVDLPVANLAKDVDLPFDILIGGNFLYES